jgi:Ca2+-binding EF-hand superfamily protein
MEEMLMPNRIGNKPPVFENLFARMDKNSDGAVSKSEVGKHLKKADVPSGLFGAVHSKTKDGFMEKLDVNRDGGITWDEFQGVAAETLPQSMRTEGGGINVDLADEAFAEFDSDLDGSIDEKELQKGTYNRIPKGTSFRGVMAEVGAKLGMDALDTNSDKLISKNEFDAAVTHASDLNSDS